MPYLAAERFVADADLFSEHVVGGLGPQLPYDPMRGVDYGFVQALLQQNADPFAEQIVGGLGPQSDLDPMMTVMTDWVRPASNVDSVSEQIVGGLGPQPFNAITYSEVFVGGQLHIIPATDVETFSVAGN